MEKSKEIYLATVDVCSFCEGKGHYQERGWDTCKHCGGTGKLIGRSLSIKQLKELLHKGYYNEKE